MRIDGERAGRRRPGPRASLVACAVAGALLALGGCEKAPLADYERALAAIEEARRESAGRWAVEEFAHAEALLKEGAEEMAAQARRASAARTFGRARETLAAAREDAEAAREAARVERQAAMEEATASLQRVRTLLEGARAALRIAPSPRDGRVERARLRDDLDAAEADLPRVQDLIEEGDYRGAASRAAGLASRVEGAVARFFDGLDRRASRPRRSRDEAAALHPAACREVRAALSLPGPRGGREGRS